MQSLCEYPEKLSSLGEVQRIIGLSLSKIQLGRNQRGGLPLHKNLLVATVLNKARDLYMQETMYMNYKMMTGHQFGMPVVSGEGTSSGGGHSSGSLRSGEDDMQESPEQEDYEEDSESDVEDDCEPRSCAGASPRAAIAASMAYPASTMAAMMMQAAAASVAASSCSNETGRLTPINPSAMQNNMRLQHQSGSESQSQEESTHQDESFSAMQGSFQHLHHLSQLHHHHQQQQQQQQQQEQMQSHSAVMVAAHAQAVAAAVAANQQQQQQQQQQVNAPTAGSDEGFIDEPDCDCDVRNFSTLETRVPFQYCYHCAPFQSANGRGPTLVPSPSSCPSLSSSNARQVEDEDQVSPTPQTLSTFHASTSRGASEPSTSSHYSEHNFTIYDMDSKSTERKAPCDEASLASLASLASRPGTKRRRKVSEAEDSPKKRRASECCDLDVVSTEDEPCSLAAPTTTTTTTTTSENSSFKPTQEEVIQLITFL